MSSGKVTNDGLSPHIAGWFIIPYMGGSGYYVGRISMNSLAEYLNESGEVRLDSTNFVSIEEAKDAICMYLLKEAG